MGSILKEYMKYQLDLENKYGTNSVILMQVGSFYEIYSVDNKFGKTIEVSKILNILQTKKNKSLPHSESNPYMAGFPVHSIGKHLLKLINSGFTVAIYNQFDSPIKSNKKIRKLVHIYSPSTYIDDEVDTKICMGINISKYKCPIQKKFVKECTIVTINLSTGKNQLFTCGDTLDYPNRVDSEIMRILAIIRPNEIVHNCKGEFKDYLNHYRQVEQKYYNINYQQKFIEKLFSGKYNITDLKLDKYSDLLTCYLFTFQFIYEHDPRIINKIQKPVFLTSSKDVILNYDAMTQLHILPHNTYKGRYRSLLDIIDFTCTRMGYRLLKSRLFYPCKDVDTLSLRYQAVENMCKVYKKIQQQLQGIGDIEKKYRKLVLLKLKPSELGKLSFSFEKINILLQDTELYDKFNIFLNDYKTTFNVDNLDKDCNFFNVPIDIKIQNKLTTIKSLLTQLTDKMTQQIDKNMHNLIKLEETEKDGFFLTTTKKRWSVFIKNNTLTQFKKFKLSELKCRELSSAMRITHPLFDKYWGMYKKLQNNFKVLLTRKYNKTLERYHTQYNELFLNVIKYIATIDVEASLAKASIKYGYTRPHIIKSKSSFVNAVKMRHPLIERIQDDSEYITTDITIRNGILLYGVNAGGKSSLLRAVGANVILAQMGAFVACEKFSFYPFHHVLCKISSEDNLFKGQSTFVCEMIELRNILNIANSNSLILCDELTAGTETHSATGLVASAIKYLLNKNSNFIFTTHLHGLPSLITHDNLKIYHFKVSIQDAIIKYNYTLSEGIGKSIYGIEIAKALGLDRDFIIDALKFRANFSRYDSTEFIQDKKSRYNRKVIMDQCEKCGVKDNLHTHHLHEQRLANENGFVNHFPKNIKHNLQVLCQECHQKEHKL